MATIGLILLGIIFFVALCQKYGVVTVFLFILFVIAYYLLK